MAHQGKLQSSFQSDNKVTLGQDHKDLVVKDQLYHVEVSFETLFTDVLIAAASDFVWFFFFVSAPLDLNNVSDFEEALQAYLGGGLEQTVLYFSDFGFLNLSSHFKFIILNFPLTSFLLISSSSGW